MNNLYFNRQTELSILCLGAHSDDIEIGCGGSLLKLFTFYNISFVKWVVFTSNESRKEEARQSASMFLKNINHEVNIHNYRDGFLPQSRYEVKEVFEKIKLEINPHIIFTHYRNDQHQDHRLVSELTWNTFRNHMILEYEVLKYDGDLGIPNLFITLDKQHVNKKIDILFSAFPSQQNKHWFDRENFTSLMRIRGMESAVNYAEAFYARKVVI